MSHNFRSFHVGIKFIRFIRFVFLCKRGPWLTPLTVSSPRAVTVDEALADTADRVVLAGQRAVQLTDKVPSSAAATAADGGAA